MAENFGELARTPYRFTGKETDRETGLGYFEQRYLEEHLGRFITPDPVLTLGARFTDPQRWGAYAYSRNNPVNYLDPQGESLVKAGVTFTKLSFKAYKQYRQTGKLDSKSLKEIGVDELVGIADDLNTVFSAETSFVDKIKAGADLIVGTELQDGELADFRAGKGKVTKERAALDNNALVAAVEKGEAAAVDAALGGRTPVVSRQAVREFLARGDKQALRGFLSARGGNVARSGTQADVAALRAQASSMGRSLKPKDARVAASAQAEGVPLITRDRKLRNFMNASGLGGENF